MLDITVEVKVPTDLFSVDALRQNLADQLRERLQYVRCPDHGRTLQSVAVVATSMNAFQFDFTPKCCEKFDTAVRKAARGA